MRENSPTRYIATGKQEICSDALEQPIQLTHLRKTQSYFMQCSVSPPCIDAQMLRPFNSKKKIRTHTHRPLEDLRYIYNVHLYTHVQPQNIMCL